MLDLLLSLLISPAQAFPIALCERVPEARVERCLRDAHEDALQKCAGAGTGYPNCYNQNIYGIPYAADPLGDCQYFLFRGEIKTVCREENLPSRGR